jgi:hypothetical protein
VPLARLTKRVFTSDETLRADIEAAHFGPAPFERASVTWMMRAATGKIAARGKLPSSRIPLGNGTSLGSVSIPLHGLAAPEKYKLAVRITPEAGAPGTEKYFENDWDVWVYPAQVSSPADPEVVVVHALDPQTVAALNSGAKVLLNIPPDQVRGDRLGPVALGFSSIFWNTAWTGRQAPHTLGILCDPKNPALASFPTEYHSNWQWWYLVSHAGAMILDELPSELRPPVQVIDDWVTNRKLGLVFEARVGPGKLLVTSIDLDHGDNPVSRQMRYSLLTYMATPRFRPTVSVTADQVNSLIKQE